MALLMSHSSTRTSVILKQKGICEKETVLEMLMRANEEQGAMLVALRAEEEERVSHKPQHQECTSMMAAGGRLAIHAHDNRRCQRG